MAKFGDENIDVEPWEFIANCDPWEITELVYFLVKYGHIKEHLEIETEFDKHLVSLIGKKHFLSRNDVNFIKKLSEDNKYFK